MRNIFYILFLLLHLTSCNEEVFMVYPPQLVVEGWIDEGGFPVVILSETVPISDIYADVNTLNDRVIKWAKVSIDDGENEVILTGKNSPSYFPPYIYTTSRMRGVAGRTYKLTVSYEDYFVEAETTIPEKVCVERFVTGHNNGNYYIKAIIDDIPEERNYYKFFVRMIGSELLLVKFAQIDSLAYEFWNEYKNYMEVKQNSIFRYTDNAKSNIKGGLGYWFGYGATEYLLEPFHHDSPTIIN